MGKDKDTGVDNRLGDMAREREGGMSGERSTDTYTLLLLLLLSRFSRVQLCAAPYMAAHQAPPVPGILQARTLEWVAISFSNA